MEGPLEEALLGSFVMTMMSALSSFYLYVSMGEYLSSG